MIIFYNIHSSVKFFVWKDMPDLNPVMKHTKSSTRHRGFGFSRIEKKNIESEMKNLIQDMKF